MSNKLEDLINAAKLGELLHKKEIAEKKKSNYVLIILAVVGVVAAIAAIAFAVYKYLTPDYLEDFDDDFDDDDFDDNEEEVKCECCSSKDEVSDSADDLAMED